jgi:hypothetical protein
MYLRLALLFLLAPFIAIAQSDYFQQKVDYKINVLLDDEAHTLNGTIEIAYQNNAPIQLDTLYFHIWPNAYRNNQSAFGRQMMRRGEAPFLFAKEENRGYIDQLDFQVDGQQVSWDLHPEEMDIAVLILDNPIPAGGKVVISTPFFVKLPYCYSRLGHVEQSYQITQWYPKPAVFDQKGWHPIPYLDMGEFYSEFGDFEVTIDLPDNYVVAATGVLQTPMEEAFLRKRIEETNAYLAQMEVDDPKDLSFPASSKKRKQITYKAESVHDFAWFADKRFMVQKDTAALSNGDKVDCWAFFTQDDQEYWKDGAAFVKRSVEFYSDKVGNYPYPQATAVQTTLGAGGGMEYPMITNCGSVSSAQGLDGLIAHEVGHNWFYGILASNERVHPWMDEGLNSYYDHLYIDTYYGGTDFSVLPAFLFKNTPMDPLRTALFYQMRPRLDQAPDTHSDELVEINYFVGAYEKPAQSLKYLAAYLGEEKYDAAMQTFYDTWQFKHPQPEDFQTSMEQSTGKSLAWFFDGLIFSTAIQDYGIQRVKQETETLNVVIKNKGQVNGPFSLSALNGDSILWTRWVEGFEGSQEVQIPKGDYTEIVIDPEQLTFDINRRDNQIKAEGAFIKLKAPNLQFFTGVEDDTKGNLFVMPLIAWNNYDKLMAGALFYNHSIPEQRWEWKLAPMYGFNSQELTGLGDLRYNIYTDESSVIRKISAGVNAQRFNYRLFQREKELLSYNRIQPYLTIDFERNKKINRYRQLRFRYIQINEEQLQFNNVGDYLGVDTESSDIQELSYSVDVRHELNKSSWTVALEHQAYKGLGGDDERYVKASWDWQKQLYFAPKRSARFRFFAGAFLHNTEREAGYIIPAAFNLISQGYNDYRYDNYYFGRTDNSGLWQQQISTRDGGFKNVIGQGFALGRSNSFILSLNVVSNLPPKVLPKLPIKAYLDLGFFHDNRSGVEADFMDQVLWSGGLMVDLFKETIAVYFPLINSKNISDRYEERGDYGKRISFQVNLHKMNPWRAVNRLEF